MISRSLGPGFGGSIGLIFSFGNVSFRLFVGHTVSGVI